MKFQNRLKTVSPIKSSMKALDINNMDEKEGSNFQPGPDSIKYEVNEALTYLATLIDDRQSKQRRWQA